MTTLLKRVLALALLLVLLGFPVFAVDATRERAMSWQAADAIVALTGGEERIQVAIGLLRQGAGRRLLISGVHPRSSAEAIRGRTGEERALFDCCIDIGREAGDTVGNAQEAREWARQRGIGSMIVVTSSYHMRRALAEFARAMPGGRFHGHPVIPRPLRNPNWWLSPSAMSLLAREYAKLLAALVRLTGTRIVRLVAP